ncbi:MAG: peptide chain release factor N(5)-glutamine methyltransferase [Clostridiales bacterium]|nr:peptide chain release factor N(5)-glutamine methyltransferase [Clostridiales bacterium]MDY3747920.1 peptide chain release factor N(5)-glutamine methyltransferase [Lachnospiraceae bacterium]
MNRRQLIDYGRQTLEAHDIINSHNDAWLLFAYVTGINRVSYLMSPAEAVPPEQEEKYKRCIEKRAAHYPLQYITHTQAFMGLDFYVDENVLVPRQDTEVLVETVLEYLKSDMDVLDMCTGSGCILISLAANVAVGCGVGADLSLGALKVAKTNAALNHTDNLTFVRSDLYEGVDLTFGMKKFDVIVSNPPYIASKEVLALMPEVRDHEPVMALDGHDDGLYFYRKIISGAKAHLKENGMIFFEIGWDQADSVSELLAAADFSQIRVKKDLAGLNRVVYAVNNS